jgi:nucleotide-binding universal stress UspA family protein
MIPAMAPLMLDARQQDLENERLVLSECLSGMQETYPDVRVSAELARGFPQELLLQRAARMNLIVVGSHVGRSAAGLAFGSVSASMVEHATCPVAVVPVGRG